MSEQSSKNRPKEALRGNQLARKLDRYTGIPLLRLLSFFRSKRSAPELIRKIAILKTVAIGDTIVLGAIIRDLKETLPNCRITLFVGSSNYRSAFLLEGVDEILELPLSNPLKAMGIIRRQRFDCFMDAGQWPRLDALLSFSAHAAFTVGFKTAGQFRHYGFDAVVEHRNTVHELENFRALLAPLKIEAKHQPKITNAEALPSTFRFVDKPLVVFHPWPGGLKGHLKEWPKKRWAAVADHLVEKGFLIGITGSPADVDQAAQLVSHCQHANSGVLNLAGQLTLPQTATLLGKARLLITVNTGIMHLAAAMDVPQLALHGPTAPLRWGPLSDRAVIIAPEDPKCGYLNLGFEYPQAPPACMEAITVEQIMDAAGAILAD